MDGNEPGLAAIVTEVMNEFFVRTKSGFKAAQAVGVDGRAPEMERIIALGCVRLDSVPHKKVAAAQFLEGLVRSAKFIEGFFAPVEIDVGCNGNLAAPGDKNLPEATRENMPVDGAKETKRLRRQTMFAAGLAVEGIESLQRLQSG